MPQTQTLKCKLLMKEKKTLSETYVVFRSVFLCLLDSYQECVNEVIGPNGGLLKGRTFQLRFPPGAVKRDTHFSITAFTPITRKFISYKVRL